jgi:phage I-like protein
MLARNQEVIAAAASSQPQEVEVDSATNGLVADNANLSKLLGLKCGTALEDIIQIALLGR